MPTIVLAPTNSAHDAIELATTAAGTAGDTDITAVTNHFGDPDTFGPRYCGIKFPLPSAGWLLNKIVNSATVAFTTNSTRSTVFDQRLYVEDAVSPANFVAGTASFDISLRARSSLFLNFGSSVLGDWVSGNVYSYSTDGVTPLRDVIQEIVNKRGPSNVSSICLIAIWQSGSGERFWRTYDHGSYPTLTLDYSIAHDIDELTVRSLRLDDRKISV